MSNPNHRTIQDRIAQLSNALANDGTKKRLKTAFIHATTRTTKSRAQYWDFICDTVDRVEKGEDLDDILYDYASEKHKAPTGVESYFTSRIRELNDLEQKLQTIPN